MIASTNIFRWNYWKFPLVCGLAMCVLQILLVWYRFGSDSSVLSFQSYHTWIGLGLFFVTGLLVGLLLRFLLRGTTAGFRILLLVAAILATPVAVQYSVFGGLLGYHFVIIAGVLPYLLLVGIPRLIGALWELWRKRTTG